MKSKFPASNPQAFEKGAKQLEISRMSRGGFAPRRSRTNRLSANLIELPVPALLRTLASKLRPDVIELAQAAIPQLVLDVGPHHASSIFRAQCQRLPFVTFSPPAILPRVHLLGHNVGLFPHPARKQFRRLENRRPNFLEVVAAEHTPHGRLHKIPQRRLRRQQVPRSSNSFNHDNPQPSAISCQLSAKPLRWRYVLIDR